MAASTTARRAATLAVLAVVVFAASFTTTRYVAVPPPPAAGSAATVPSNPAPHGLSRPLPEAPAAPALGNVSCAAAKRWLHERYGTVFGHWRNATPGDAVPAFHAAEPEHGRPVVWVQQSDPPALDGGPSAAVGALLEGHRRRCSSHRDPPRISHPLRRYTAEEAGRCLVGRRVLFWGDSNTRTMMTALEALLQHTPQQARLATKARCTGSRMNHTCSARVVPRGAQHDSAVGLEFYSHRNALYQLRPGRFPAWYLRSFDAVVLGQPFNHVAKTRSTDAAARAEDLASAFGRRVVAAFPKAQGRVFVMTTAPLCPTQPHYRGYRYKPKVWGMRPLNDVNAVLDADNAAVRLHSETGPAPYSVLDGAAMVAGRRDVHGMGSAASQPSESAAALCTLYDDGLHHRFLDRELLQRLLSQLCPTL